MEQAAPLLDRDGSPQDISNLPDGDLEKSETLLQRYQTRWEKFRAQVLVPSNLLLILPRYIQPGGRKEYIKDPSKISPTAYLDALRGYAAFFVFFYHGWASKFWVIQLPFIRVMFLGGAGMVATFFVISGYVLSYRLLKLIHNRETARLLDALCSSIFRRWLRLYGSTAVGTCLAAILVYLGWYVPNPVLRKATILAQVWDWALNVIVTSNPFANIEGWWHPGVFFTAYLPQMWTIPVEFRGSVLLFMFCAASAKLTTKSRMILLWSIILLSYYWRCVYVAEFLYGMFVAELSLLRHPERLGRPALPTEGEATSRKPANRSCRILQTAGTPVGSCIALVLGLLLLSQPDPPNLGVTGPFPFQYLSQLIPPWFGDAGYTFWLSIGAFLVVFALDSYPPLQRPLTLSFSQYLGDLSFGIYVMHNIVIQALYKKVLIFWQVQYLGISYVAFLPAIIVTALVVLWTADFFTRIDKKVVQFGRWLQMKTFTKWE